MEILCDRSEGTMFVQGGAQIEKFDEDELTELQEWLNDLSQFRISFQLNPSERTSFRNVVSNSAKHREFWDEEKKNDTEEGKDVGKKEGEKI